MAKIVKHSMDAFRICIITKSEAHSKLDALHVLPGVNVSALRATSICIASCM
ncbi:hypothetical protein PDE_02199 [Penicillium oxalicum 114-2]|uniref:Uncharacterized protein n=1 Tax=Penicillium oxalicum (strain 114-2 / CGMCC 5302) TaxID=933388 RepID=S7ZEZ4_PENO1|nr:hypothetical protein PDE_02199 [Penicillium oxalicum 114-2]